MPRILLHSATEPEIRPTLEFLKPHVGHNSKHFKLHNCDINVCISGAGMVASAFALGQLSTWSFDLAIQAGIGGSFKDLPIGTLVSVDRDCFSELGAEDGDHFLSIDKLGLGQQEQNFLYPFRHKLLNTLPKLKGITVNTVHGEEESIKKIRDLYDPDVESMEGAAFIYACNLSGWPALQLRAISNRVEKRDRSKWDIPKAVNHLNTFLIQFLKALDEN